MLYNEMDFSVALSRENSSPPHPLEEEITILSLAPEAADSYQNYKYFKVEHLKD